MAPCVDQHLGDGALDRLPLLDLLAPAPGREDGEVRRRPVGVDVGEAAEHAARSRRTPRARPRAARAHHLLVEAREALPRDRRLEGLADDADRDQQVAHVGGAEERAAPRPDRVAARPPAAAAACRRARRRSRARARARPRRGGRSTRSRAPAARGCRRRPSSAPPRPRRAGGSWTGTARTGRSRARTRRRAMKSGKRTPADARCAGARLYAHPRARDHAEDALGAREQAVGARTGARAGQPARLPYARRRDRARGLQEVLDVGPDRREMARGAGGDPAAERRVLERLREVAQGEAVLAELAASSAGPVAPRLDARRAGDLVDLEQAVERAPGRSRRRRCSPGRTSGVTPPTTDVPPP